ncbi:S9 family peptidase [Nevskia soli]|uniref:S9 family peptidase n=1 Tax=Nevskia soli TaxID=418856 RepID=UPI0006892057|nr:S9 family peptidase [Nevskia soli]
MITIAATPAPRPFNSHDLVTLDRVSDPQVSPDGKTLVFSVRETDLAANKGVRSIWRLSLQGKDAQPERLTAKGSNADTPRWSPDGKALYFLSSRSGGTQIWRLDAGMGEARQVTSLPLDVNNFIIAPDGKRLALSIDVFTDCADLACTKKRLDDKEANKATGTVYNRLFIRHWDTWADGRRSQLFIADLDEEGTVSAAPRWITRDANGGIDGDVPSKPFGDESEYCFSPDGKTVYFGVRIAGNSEPWSTNFDIYSVPTAGGSAPKNLTADNPAWDANPAVSKDGSKLYYLAMKRPTFEADRFGIMELDLASGKKREVDPEWDRSAGSIRLSEDGHSIYALADDNGEHPLFSIDIRSGKVKKLVGEGNVSAYTVAGDSIFFSRDTLKSPADLFRLKGGGKATRLTAFNTEKLKNVAFGDYEFFQFKGWNDDTVQGYVVKPANYVPGKKYPVAFLIHGGPQGSWLNDFHYRWNPQTYAGAGFAVVTIDFHGSTGYGQAFTDAITGHWGDRPLEDLQKGWAAALAKYSFLDGNHACALGASYGGYMINWIAGNWNTPWKCLVNHDGVFDNRAMAYSTEELWFDEWENQGTQWQKPENYERFNPINHVADWKVPMLVVHSGNDFRIPLEQGIAAFTVLQRRGIPSQFLTFPEESHWVQKPQNSLQWHDTVEAWIKKWTAAE